MRLVHVGLNAKDPGSLAGFYERFLGLRRVGEAVTEQSGAMIFLSSNENGAPDLQLMSNPGGRHFAFQVDSLAELRKLYAEAPSRGATVVMSLDHGPTFSFYVRDPDGNVCEVCWPTGRRSAGQNRPVDLTRSEEELLELIRA
jgi:catechol-2,3-dioxygenase